MKRRWTGGLLGASLTWFALQPSTLAMPDPAHLIVPGKAIGPVALGAHVSDLKARIGPPDDVRAIDSDHALLQWREYSLVVGVEQERVVLVGTNSNQYQTSTGLKVGVPGVRALAMFPGLTPPKVRGLFGLVDDVMGINFLHHPADAHGVPLKSFQLPEDWVIDEINVYQSSNDLVIDRKDAPL
ncbi:MAG TPA: hypothetical protein V6D05_00505 [Stenomitos sp.]